VSSPARAKAQLTQAARAKPQLTQAAQTKAQLTQAARAKPQLTQAACTDETYAVVQGHVKSINPDPANHSY